jgi:hypothetical protein
MARYDNDLPARGEEHAVILRALLWHLNEWSALPQKAFAYKPGSLSIIISRVGHASGRKWKEWID